MKNLLKILLFLLILGACESGTNEEETSGPPSISGFSPSRQAVGLVVTIFGSNFNISPGNNKVLFNGAQATVSHATRTSLAVVVPSNAENGIITVTTPEGTAKATSDFYVLSGAAPKINSFSPVKGHAGTVVTINGENFDPIIKNNDVYFNGTVAEVTAATSTSLQVIVPVATNGGISVVTLGGQVRTSKFFLFVPPDDGITPQIESFTPLRGSMGDTITITGINFDPTPGNNVVKINDTTAVVTAASTTEITATIPDTTTGALTVSTAGGIATFDADFEVLPAGGYTPIPGLMGGTIQSAPLYIIDQATTFAGGGIEASAIDGIGVDARLINPLGIDSDGTYLYFAEGNSRKIRRLTLSTQQVTTIAGTGVEGSVDGLGANAQFFTPTGIVEINGSLFIADSGDNKIRKMDLGTDMVSTLAGSGTFFSRDGTGDRAAFMSPYGITTDDGTHLYVADSAGHRIRAIEIATAYVSTLAGSSDASSDDGTGDSASFYRPHGIAHHNGDLYIADSANHKIRKLNIATRVVSTLAGSGEPDFEDGMGDNASFHSPEMLSTDGTYLYVTDAGNHLIRRVEISSGAVTTLAGSNYAGHKDQIGILAEFSNPLGIVAEGPTLYVTDAARVIRKVETSSAQVTTIAGEAVKINAINDIGTAAIFNHPFGIASDGTNLYVADASHRLIRKIRIATAKVTTLAGSGFFGDIDGTATSASFNYPFGITTDGVSVFVSDAQNHKIRRVLLSNGTVTTLAGSGNVGNRDGIGKAAEFSQPTGLTTDGDYVYIADTLNHKIRQISIATGEVTTLAGSGEKGVSEGIGENASFNKPEGITTNGTTLFVADSGNNKIRAIVISTGEVTTLAGSGEYRWMDGFGVDSAFQYPRGITTDGTYLYVADSDGRRIREIHIATGEVRSSTGSGDSGTSDGTGTRASFMMPAGLTSDGNNLFLTDYLSHQIRKID